MKRYESEEFLKKIKDSLGLENNFIATEFCFLAKIRNEKICDCHCLACLKKSLDFLCEEVNE